MNDEDTQWRQTYARVNPAGAGLPVSLHAVQLLSARGHDAAAIAACHELLGQRPRDENLLRLLAGLLSRAGQPDDARACLADALRIELDRLGMSSARQDDATDFLLCAEGYGRRHNPPPDEYLSAYFDSYADDFEERLVGRLAYRGPELLWDAVRAAGQVGERHNILDLGCGTGLVGQRFRSLARRIDGVDLSRDMIDRARAKKVYDSLHQAEITDFLLRVPGRYDMLLAADVFIYVGALDAVFTAGHEALAPNGILAFTVEAANGDGVHLTTGRRFAHSLSYLHETAAQTGFAVILTQDAPLRNERGKPVPAHTCVLGRTGAAFARGGDAVSANSSD